MFEVQDDRRYGRADGVRELCDEGESVGAGRETGSIGYQELMRWSSILVRVEVRQEDLAHL